MTTKRKSRTTRTAATNLNFAVSHKLGSEVSDAEEEAILAVSEADDGPLGEQQRLGALLWPCQLGEDEADDASLPEDAEDRLDHHEENGFGAFLRRVPGPVALQVSYIR